MDRFNILRENYVVKHTILQTTQTTRQSRGLHRYVMFALKNVKCAIYKMDVYKLHSLNGLDLMCHMHFADM